MNINVADINVGKKNVATVTVEQTFWVGPTGDIEVVVQLYHDNNNNYKMTSWLNGTEELNTIDYEGSIDDSIEILSTMEKLVNDNEEYILDIASWDGE